VNSFHSAHVKFRGDGLTELYIDSALLLTDGEVLYDEDGTASQDKAMAPEWKALLLVGCRRL
jgi:hypothetical protein